MRTFKPLPSCIVAIVVFGVAGVFASNTMASSIYDIEQQSSGSAATLDSAPVITFIGSQPGTFGGHTYTSWSIFAQDSTGAIDLFGSLPGGTTEPTPTVGDAVNAAGTFSPFHQIPEIASMTSLTHVSTGNSVPTPMGYTVSQSIAGYVLRLQNVTLYTDSAATIPVSGNFAAANTALYAKDSNGDIMETYFWYTSYSADGAMVGNPIPTGPVDIIGFVSQSGSFAPEITPLAFVTVPEPSTMVLIALAMLGLLGFRRR